MSVGPPQQLLKSSFESMPGVEILEDYGDEITEVVEKLPADYFIKLKFKHTLNFLKEHGCIEYEDIRSAKVINDTKLLLPGEFYTKKENDSQNQTKKKKGSKKRQTPLKNSNSKENGSIKTKKANSVTPGKIGSVDHMSLIFELSPGKKTRRRTLYSPESFENSTDFHKLFGTGAVL